jgi:gamma-glutamyltranspeptidase/glutathione hydrolase
MYGSPRAPRSFAELGVVAVESRVDPDVISELEARGHRVQRCEPWEHGRVLAVTTGRDSGRLEAAASSRQRIAYAAALP